jgi:hypothetical protein
LKKLIPRITVWTPGRISLRVPLLLHGVKNYWHKNDVHNKSLCFR